MGLVTFTNTSSGYEISNTLIEPSAATVEGDGGPSEGPLTTAIFQNTTSGYDLELSTVNATFTWSIPDPVFEPLTVRFTGAPSTGFLAPLFFWDFGDGFTYTGQSISFTFDDYGVHNVELIVVDNEGIGLTDNDIQVVNVVDDRVQPVETAAEVMNLTLGRHAYEPIRTTEGLVPAGEIRAFATQAVVKDATADILSQQVLSFGVLRNVLVSGPTDALYRLYLDDVQIIPARRIYRHHRDIDLLQGAKIAIPERGTIRVEVVNQGIADGTFEASIHGAKA